MRLAIALTALALGCASQSNIWARDGRYTNADLQRDYYACRAQANPAGWALAGGIYGVAAASVQTEDCLRGKGWYQVGR
jgi:hypothetical protein